MALINKLTAIADAIRSKTGRSGSMTLDQMASEIAGIVIPTFSTQTKSVTITENGTTTVNKDSGFDGMTAVNVTTNVPIPDGYLKPSGSQTLTENGTFDVKSLASVIVDVASSGGLPAGISAVATGEHTPNIDYTTTQVTITHNLGVVPDLVLYYYDGGNIAQTYTMLWSLRFTKLGYRSSAYTLYNAYHSNSTTTVGITNSNSTSAGVSNLTATTFKIASNSTSYYWRGGKTYKWIAIKFS